MNEDVLSNIRSRVERCRYLASVITDGKAASILRKMAEEGEADIKRLEAGESAGDRIPTTTDARLSGNQNSDLDP